MGLLGIERRDSINAAADGFVSDLMQRDRGGRFGSRPGPVSADMAMAHSGVWGSASLISDVISTMAIDGHKSAPAMLDSENNPNNLSTAATNTASTVVVAPTPSILDDPSDVLDPISWRFSALMSALLQGMAAGTVTRQQGLGPMQEALKCELFDAKRVGWTAQGGWTVDNRPRKLWPVGDLWLMPGYTLPGSPVGLSVLRYAASAIGLGLAAESYGRETFTESAHPSGILKNTAVDIDETQSDEIKRRWTERFRGRREPAVVGKDWEYSNIVIPAEDSQFLETIQANVATVARFFRVPPEMIGAASGASMTYSNIETRMLSLLMLTLAPWLRRLERSLSTLLPAPQVAIADETSILRTDSATMSKMLDLYVKDGVMNRDEARARLGLPPLPDGAGQAFNWPPMNMNVNADAGDPEAETTAPGSDLAPTVETTTKEGF